jgi:hypothetical protein
MFGAYHGNRNRGGGERPRADGESHSSVVLEYYCTEAVEWFRSGARSRAREAEQLQLGPWKDPAPPLFLGLQCRQSTLSKVGIGEAKGESRGSLW